MSANLKKGAARSQRFEILGGMRGRRRRALHWASCFIAGITWFTAAHARIVPESDHTVWITINSVPVGADVFAFYNDSSTPVRVGSTPCRIPVDINWRRSWFVRRWELIEVLSPANVCRAVRRPDNGYDLRASLRLTKPGFEARDLDAVLCTLDYPGKRWAQKVRWPRESQVDVELLPTATPITETHASKNSRLRRVLVAERDASGETGVLVVRANVESADVWVDGRRVAQAPVELVLSEGPHLVEIRKASFVTVMREIVVLPDKRRVFNALLLPEVSSP